ncbi:hypothetical protein PLICRDRAFT_36631 [Plicaturopsis crispa FD-325 SS-3]|nr:hypothetical protein PLICRDRAFT_36631 [Plicaturopsis crispa FD-325 SS-3]
MADKKLRVLLTNDDGPPGPDSPYIYGLFRHLTDDLGWDVKAVVPSSQKSWIGKAYQITDAITGRYYYPSGADGKGETSPTSRPLREGEVAEWILLDGTPATCANVGLHNLYLGEIDLLISGPNLGRNTSSAFALSSGTIGAALSSSLSGVRSIAVSYGTVLHPTPPELFEPAHLLASRIIRHLWANWGKDDGGLRGGDVDLYNLNIPMVRGLLSDDGLEICWTRIWRNSYGRLFKAVPLPEAQDDVPAPGPDAPNADRDSAPAGGSHTPGGHLHFKFSPDIGSLITPSLSSIPVGSDGWAMHKGFVSITPLRASFAEPLGDDRLLFGDDADYKVLKLKL